MNYRVLSATTCLCILLTTARAADAPPSIEGCQIFPADNLWNRDVSGDQVDPDSDSYIADILTGANKFLHPDFNSGPFGGIPYVVVNASQPKVAINAQYADESDPGPYPIPPEAPIEGGSASTGDRHVLVLDKDSAILYELFSAYPDGNGGWDCGSAAKFNLKSNALRPDNWTSADAAGLPILPGLVRFDEVATGAITHCLRFTVHRSAARHIAPATHHAGATPTAPPMGLRLRLKASFELAAYTGQAKVVLLALKKYGMMVADNGSDWFITGAPDPRWNDDDLRQLKSVPGSAFEVVRAGSPVSGGSSGSQEPLDSDGDGFSNELEVALGTSPTELSSTPFGGAPAGAVLPLEVSKLSMRLNFAVTGRDSIVLSATLPIAENFVPGGKQLVLDVGGVIESFTLDDKGRALSARGALKLRYKRVAKVVPAQSGKLQVKLTGSEFWKALADEGFSGSEDIRQQTREVPVTVLFNGSVQRKFQSQIFSAKAGKTGRSK